MPKHITSSSHCRSNSLTVWVQGEPEPSGSPRVIRRGKNGPPAIIWQKGPKWQKQIKRQAAEQIERPIEGPVSVRLVFHLPKPKKPKYPVPATKPDIDKLARSTLDGLTGVAFEDDSRVVMLTVRKAYVTPGAPTGVDIWVSPYDP